MRGLDTRDTHTHTQTDYSNPRCACAPRVKNRISVDVKETFPRSFTVPPFDSIGTHTHARTHCKNTLYTSVLVLLVSWWPQAVI